MHPPYQHPLPLSLLSLKISLKIKVKLERGTKGEDRRDSLRRKKIRRGTAENGHYRGIGNYE